jgi:hypothetical protein
MDKIEHFFSPSTGGWYNEAIHGTRRIADPQTEAQIEAGRKPRYRANPACTIPTDAIAADHDQWQELLLAQGKGKIIAIEAGRVVAVDPGLPSAEDQLAAIRAKRDRLLAATDAMVSVPDYPITESQRAQLLDWREALREFPALIVTQLPLAEIKWPPRPTWIGENGEKL